MRTSRRQRGLAAALLAVFASVLFAAMLAASFAAPATRLARDRASDRARAAAREALIAHATARPIDRVVGPGYLPCPDLDDDGWAEATCGSMDGSLGQASRLGRLPWKTLGLPDLRDGAGERLWYAVSSRYKGLLNCTLSPACLDMSPESALGTITVRDPTGAIVHDGAAADASRAHAGGALAVLFAPGPVLDRHLATGEWRTQRRDCDGACGASGQCLTRPASLTPKCHPANYLDAAPGAGPPREDNADFVDRNDAAGRSANRDGFIRGPVFRPDGSIAVNDRLAVIGYDDLQPRLARRVAEEAARCLRAGAVAAGNAVRYPWAAPLCRSLAPDAALARAGEPGTRFGRLPDPLPAEHLPEEQCAIAGGGALAWWSFWHRYVFYAVAPDFDPASPGTGSCATDGACLHLVDGAGTTIAGQRHFALIVAGAPLAAASQRRDASRALDAANWLEGGRAALEGLNPDPAAPQCERARARASCPAPDSCARVALSPRGPLSNDVILAHP